MGTVIMLLKLLVPLAVTVGVGMQLPPVTQQEAIQKGIEDLARKSAEELIMVATARTTGLLHPEADASFRRLGEAVRLWKKEPKAGAAPLLAEGVLLDCLARLTGLQTSRLPGEKDPGTYADVADVRSKSAAKVLEEALKIDPDLIEARMRLARLRAPHDPKARLDLEEIVEEFSGSPFAYLSAVSLGVIAQANGDADEAIRWYERALALFPASTAAVIALSTLRPTAPLPFDALAADDLYYSYPCMVLTSDVRVELTERLQRGGQK